MFRVGDEVECEGVRGRVIATKHWTMQIKWGDESWDDALERWMVEPVKGDDIDMKIIT